MNKKGITEGYSYYSKAALIDPVIAYVAFSNRSINEMRENKPHIKMVGKYWRVNNWNGKKLYLWRWTAAHRVIHSMNERRSMANRKEL